MKSLIFLRAVSGSGKTTFAKMLERFGFGIVAADDFFTSADGSYQYDPSRTVEAHSWCQQRCEQLLTNPHISGVVVHNTSTRAADVAIYKALADKHGHQFISLVVENYHGNSDVHDVPPDALVRQEKQLRESLRLRPSTDPICVLGALGSNMRALGSNARALAAKFVDDIVSNQPIDIKIEGAKLGQMSVVATGTNVGKSMYDARAFESLHAYSIVDMVYGVFCPSDLDEMERVEFITGCLLKLGVTANDVKSAILNGMAYGYTIEQQVELLRDFYKTTHLGA